MRVLYLSYDGLTDPLGASQILPYVKGLAAQGHSYELISCEKPAAYAARRGFVESQLAGTSIGWHPLVYHKRPPLLSTVYDLLQMRLLCSKLQRQQPFELVHCRSYLTALIGHWLRRTQGVRFVFDMRGFWADERVDGRIWSLSNPVYRLVYHFFKGRERRFFKDADAIVSLTAAGQDYIAGHFQVPASKIQVIPCCVDTELFDPERVHQNALEKLREQLGLERGHLVLAYLGSLGTWYLTDEMLDYFRVLQQERPEARLLLITPDPASEVLARAAQRGVSEELVRVYRAERTQVPVALSLAQAGVCLIQPAFSKLASSPTKYAEMLAMGLPVVVNSGVGDMQQLAERHQTGPVLHAFDDASLRGAVGEMLSCLERPSAHYRQAAVERMSLGHALNGYQRTYSTARTL